MKKGVCVLAIALASFLPQASSALVENDANLFECISVCSAYESFLANRAIEGTEACHPIANFLISSARRELNEFAAALKQFAGESSTLGSLGDVLEASTHLSPVAVYKSTDTAIVLTAIFLGAAQDIERAAVYSLLLRNMQSRAVSQSCRPDLACAGLRPDQSLAGILGSRFETLDQRRPEAVLECLVRADALLTPVRRVIESARFRACLESH